MVLSGRIEFLPHNVYTAFPFLTEMLLLSTMVLSGDWFAGGISGQLVLAAFGPLAAIVVFSSGRPIQSLREMAGSIHLSLDSLGLPHLHHRLRRRGTRGVSRRDPGRVS